MKRKIITVGEFRSNIKQELDNITGEGVQLIIKRPSTKGGNVIVVSEREFMEMEETAYLLSSKANRRHLIKSIQQAKNGKVQKKTVSNLWK